MIMTQSEAKRPDRPGNSLSIENIPGTGRCEIVPTDPDSDTVDLVACDDAFLTNGT